MPKVKPKVHEVWSENVLKAPKSALTRDAAKDAGVSAVRTDFVARNQMDLIHAGHKLGRSGEPYPKQKPRKKGR